MLDQVKTDIDALMAGIGRNARAAARPLAIATADEKNRALEAMAAEIFAKRDAILAANALDLANARESGVAASFIDRLTLTVERVEGITERLVAGALLQFRRHRLEQLVLGEGLERGLRVARAQDLVVLLDQAGR